MLPERWLRVCSANFATAGRECLLRPTHPEANKRPIGCGGAATTSPEPPSKRNCGHSRTSCNAYALTQKFYEQRYCARRLAPGTCRVPETPHGAGTRYCLECIAQVAEMKGRFPQRVERRTREPTPCTRYVASGKNVSAAMVMNPPAAKPAGSKKSRAKPRQGRSAPQACRVATAAPSGILRTLLGHQICCGTCCARAKTTRSAPSGPVPRQQP